MQPRLREPIAIVAENGQIVVANRKSGSISIIDPKSMEIVGEHNAARQIADMARHPTGSGVFLHDDAQNMIVHATIERGKIRKRDFYKTQPSSQKIVVVHDVICVASRWKRAVTITCFDRSLDVENSQHIQLDFVPHEMLVVDGDRKLLVAGAFRGELAVIDLRNSKLLHTKQIDGHNIRGLALSSDGDHVFVSHQRLNSIVQTDFDGVHWGNLMMNMLTKISVKMLLDPESRIRRGMHEEQLGLSGSATGDPDAVFVAPNGQRAIALSGIGEVAVTGTSFAHRVRVGRRPTAMTMLDGKLFVANQFSDSVSVIDMSQGKTLKEISLGKRPKLTATQRGERLFFDARLSHDGWMSCHSCHSDGHTIGGLADTLGDGNYGAPKRIPTLLGTKDTAPWGWTGSAATLHEQVKSSVKSTMQGKELTEAQTSDLVAFLNSLPPPPAYKQTEKELQQWGELVFQLQGCTSCHAAPNYSSSQTYDVGMADERGTRRFNPPSLRGLGQRDRFFHDARYSRIEDVVVKQKHQIDKRLNDEELRALVYFLRSL